MTITTYTDREIALRQQLAAATQLAQLNGEIAAELKADKLALEAAIEASRGQEAIGEVSGNDWSCALLYQDFEPGAAVYAAPVIAPDVLKDAQRYRWLREQSWMDNLCVVDSPKSSVKLGSFCPSQGRLDSLIDAAMGGAND